MAHSRRTLRRFGLIVFSLFILYGVTRLAAVRFTLADKVASVCATPFICLTKALVDPIKDYCATIRLWRDNNRLCQQLAAERDELQSKVIEMEAVAEVAESTRELSAFIKRYSTGNGIVTQVLTRYLTPQKHFFLVDAGSKQGVSTDMVAVYKNCLVGRVSEVFPFYSRVMLITDPSCKIAAWCQGEAGIHEGEGALDVTSLSHVFDRKLDLLKRIKAGDLVLSSGEGLIFPKGFGLGKVISIIPDDVRCTIKLSPLIDVEKLDYCCLITKGAECLSEDRPESKTVALPSIKPRPAKTLAPIKISEPELIKIPEPPLLVPLAKTNPLYKEPNEHLVVTEDGTGFYTPIKVISHQE